MNMLSKKMFLKIAGIWQMAIEKRWRKQKSAGVVWMFHSVVCDGETMYDEEFSIEVGRFQRLVAQNMSEGKQFCEISKIAEGNENNIYVTFDDCFEDVYVNAYPILKEYRIPFCLFISMGLLDEPPYISTEHLRQLVEDPLCTIGGHAVRHIALRGETESVLRQEIIDGKMQLERLIGRTIDYFAYPYGDIASVNSRAVRIVRAAGYKMAFSTISSHITEDSIKDRYFIPRINVNNNMEDR